MYILTKSIHISASHCLIGHPKCGRMHGHNYEVQVYVGSHNLDKNGMVMDFGDLSKVLDDIIGPFDHRHIGIIPEGWTANLDHVINVPFENTTAENLAKFWGEKIQQKINPIKLVEINVFETPRSKATWNPNKT